MQLVIGLLPCALRLWHASFTMTKHLGEAFVCQTPKFPLVIESFYHLEILVAATFANHIGNKTTDITINYHFPSTLVELNFRIPVICFLGINIWVRSSVDRSEDEHSSLFSALERILVSLGRTKPTHQRTLSSATDRSHSKSFPWIPHSIAVVVTDCYFVILVILLQILRFFCESLCAFHVSKCYRSIFRV